MGLFGNSSAGLEVEIGNFLIQSRQISEYTT